MTAPTLDSPVSPHAGIRELLVERIHARQLELPLLPQTATEVLDVCNDTSCDASKLAGMIQRDQALAAHTLHVANSAAYAPREPIVSLQQAVSRLGFKTMCDIAVAISMRSKVFVVKGQEERIRGMWTHSAMAGAWAKEIARARRRNVEGAFLCGLLHDIGQPVILQTTLELWRGRGCPPDEALLDRLIQEFHGEVGGLVLEKWKLPDWMCTSVRCHHDPDTAGDHAEFARTALLADLLAHATEHPDADTDAALRQHPVLGDLDLYSDETEALFARREFVVQLADAFH